MNVCPYPRSCRPEQIRTLLFPAERCAALSIGIFIAIVMPGTTPGSFHHSRPMTRLAFVAVSGRYRTLRMHGLPSILELAEVSRIHYLYGIRVQTFNLQTQGSRDHSAVRPTCILPHLGMTCPTAIRASTSPKARRSAA